MFGAGVSDGNAVDVIAQQRDRADAAMQLAGVKLESVGVAHLIQAAVEFYDLLCANDTERTGLTDLTPPLRADDSAELAAEASRKQIAKRWFVLHTKYNDEDLKNPRLYPLTLKQLLLKFVWLSYLQLPEYRAQIDSAAYLNWGTFQRWMRCVFKHQYH